MEKILIADDEQKIRKLVGDFLKKSGYDDYKDLSNDELDKIRDEISNYVVEGELRKDVALDIKRLKEIRCYRGLRHIANLPVRGQSSKQNARTRKGPKKTIANKKK